MHVICCEFVKCDNEVVLLVTYLQFANSEIVQGKNQSQMNPNCEMITNKQHTTNSQCYSKSVTAFVIVFSDGCLVAGIASPKSYPRVVS